MYSAFFSFLVLGGGWGGGGARGEVRLAGTSGPGHCLGKQPKTPRLIDACRGVRTLESAQVKDFSRLYTRKAHVHHYTEFMEKAQFDEAYETVNTLIKDYIHLDMLKPVCKS